ncbi:serine hydrolase domain-containing protein [Pseudoalteromonas fenneropenaei]|uniref:Serine hydrolase domain-containing protein n=1 Tax=Pseudoalteromonas fenneropenaei TaxID=1737459 RepID=A0ABV7CK70_9GAMM
MMHMQNSNPVFSLLLLCCVSATCIAGEPAQRNAAPRASAEEAQLKHWRMPDIKRTFWDISELSQAYIDVAPAALQDGVVTAQLGRDGGNQALLVKLGQEIANKQHQQVDSLLVAHQGKLVFESYYARGRIDLPHPQSSTTKSYTSLALGRAMQLGYLSMADLHKPLLEFLPNLDTRSFVKGVETITLHQVLSMSSGLKFSSEKIQQYGSEPERYYGLKRVQAFFSDSEPVSSDAKTFNYQGPNPDLAMQVLEAVVPGSAQDFIKQELFGKLGIVNYDWRVEQDGVPTAGALSSLTSRDMLKLGSLVLNKGKWQGEQLIPAAYIAKATDKIVALNDEQVKNFYAGDKLSDSGYGYFWFQTRLKVGDKYYVGKSAQGGGGVTILVVEELELVVVVTAHARQAYLQMAAEHVLPAFVQ